MSLRITKTLAVVYYLQKIKPRKQMYFTFFAVVRRYRFNVSNIHNNLIVLVKVQLEFISFLPIGIILVVILRGEGGQGSKRQAVPI